MNVGVDVGEASGVRVREDRSDGEPDRRERRVRDGAVAARSIHGGSTSGEREAMEVIPDDAGRRVLAEREE